MSSFASYPGRVYVSRARMREFIAVNHSSLMEQKDARIDRDIVAMSEWIDTLCGRTFLPHIATYKFNYQTSYDLHFFKDLISVTSITDYQGALTADQYELFPLNSPSEVPPRPYRWLEMDRTERLLTYGVNPRAAIEIDAKWGWAEITRSYGTALDGDLSDSATTLSLTNDIGVSPGTILLIDSEQIFVTDSADLTAPVITRGINGTTAAAHTAASAVVYTLHPPGPIEHAVCVLVSRSLARGDSGWADLVGGPIEGYKYVKALPSEVGNIIRYYQDKELQNFRVLKKDFWWNVGTNVPI